MNTINPTVLGYTPAQLLRRGVVVGVGGALMANSLPLVGAVVAICAVTPSEAQLRTIKAEQDAKRAKAKAERKAAKRAR